MRWKLLVLVSLIAALIASASWFLLIILFFNGSAAILPLAGELWPLSLALPFLLAIFGGFFVYRHTSRRRKTQALITGVVVLALTALVCLTVLGLLRKRSTHGCFFICHAQPNLFLHRFQRVNHEPDVIIERVTQLLSALINIVTIN